jgi:hypothetical protein
MRVSKELKFNHLWTKMSLGLRVWLNRRQRESSQGLVNFERENKAEPRLANSRLR